MDRRTRPYAGAVMGILIALVVVLVVVNIVRTGSVVSQIRASQKINTGTLNATRATLKAVRSCTTPGEECYADGQKRTGQAVGNINRVVILAAACSVGIDAHLSVVQRQTEIQTCVIARLSQP